MSDEGRARILAAIDRLEASQNKVRADIMERIDRLQHTVDQMRSVKVFNVGNTDRAERTARAAMDEGRITADIIRTMQRRIARLQNDIEPLRGRAA
jgi:hypothetical protein